ncbi:hypothetical protein [Prochlorothrix hollandica]|uniref:hypothetical protein n=1 Tax=Prochlorothrix hollandica TaxID=1223 RepID=UPI000346517E|nr:hypothetical protein [Prochlorothrix hollandica]
MSYPAVLPHRLRHFAAEDWLLLSSHDRHNLALWLKTENWPELWQWCQRQEATATAHA